MRKMTRTCCILVAARAASARVRVLTFSRWDDWVPQERIRKLTDENKELANNLKKDMDAQRRAAAGKPPLMSATKKRPYGSDLTASSMRGSEDRSSAAPPPPPRGVKRGREIEGIDKVCQRELS